MAESLAHRWGQIIGDIFEHFVRDVLAQVAGKHGLYLDYKKPRKARTRQGGGKDLSKVTWQDGYGNKHDLDYVLERGGTEDSFGTPVAFIESAWRRYTKHSKNKAQEIEAAVMPVALAFARHQPFCGAVLAGEFSSNALQQLESKGFAVLHIPYGSILAAFREMEIDASSEDGDGGTEEADFRLKITAWEKLKQPVATRMLIAKWHSLHGDSIKSFVDRLASSITRKVTMVRLSVLRGHSVEVRDIESAIHYLIEEENSSRLREDGEQRESFEIQLRFNNGAKVEALFPSRQEAIAFLRGYNG
ncbi:MAG: DNA methylase [Fimbriimonadaceae bacterium]